MAYASALVFRESVADMPHSVDEYYLAEDAQLIRGVMDRFVQSTFNPADVEAYRLIFLIAIAKRKKYNLGLSCHEEISLRLEMRRAPFTPMLNGKRTMDRKYVDELIAILELDKVCTTLAVYKLGDPLANFDHRILSAARLLEQMLQDIFEARHGEVHERLTPVHCQVLSQRVISQIVAHQDRVAAAQMAFT